MGNEPVLDEFSWWPLGPPLDAELLERMERGSWLSNADMRERLKAVGNPAARAFEIGQAVGAGQRAVKGELFRAIEDRLMGSRQAVRREIGEILRERRDDLNRGLDELSRPIERGLRAQAEECAMLLFQMAAQARKQIPHWAAEGEHPDLAKRDPARNRAIGLEEAAQLMLYLARRRGRNSG